jgi:hypothetical protein
MVKTNVKIRYMPKTETPTYVCHYCKKSAIGRYSPNEGEVGLGFCLEHQEVMAAAFYCLLNNRVSDFNKLMGTNLDINEI